ncbi:hypothetical protein TCDM_09282 [Trypanosoma cruzi Dm28c]|uniref:Uncharacterized protein n=1 Tax=Trypanosoma cruzi Dm28c TaxID=1416333 RepID=V5AQC4_TRYCR|nr:hypothetical protein TCDM_09282 [Trypanosoma cruzi Dm28c]
MLIFFCLFLCACLTLPKAVCRFVMSSVWKVLVQLHNVVNIPCDVCSNDECDDARVFSVVARAVSSNGTLLTECPEVIAEFTTRDIVQASAADPLEVKLDGRGERGAAVSAEWSTNAPTIGLMLLVKERQPTCERVIGSCEKNLVIDVSDVVQRRKIVTHIVGTEMGRVGVSLTVAPSDTAGYRRRLTEFLSQYNPGGLHLVDSVVRGIPEVETFTKLYRKYALVDYERRVRDFFRVYGREHAVQVPLLLKEWENREEELMHNLVLDNGPEPDNIDAETRLEAFLRAHNVSTATPDVARALRESNNTPFQLFEALSLKYGPEPDPRSYLFPPTHYELTQTQYQLRQLRPTSVPPIRAAENKWSPQREISSNGGTKREEEGKPFSQHQRQQTSPVILSVSHFDPPAATETDINGNGDHSYGKEKDTRSVNFGNNAVMSWDGFCDLLRRQWREPSDVYYMSEASFSAVAENMGYTKPDRDILIHQWQQRLRAAVREEVLTPGDAYYGTAMKEVLNLVGLQELNLEVVSVTMVSNREHASCFANRLLTAQQRATERLAIVGEYHRLRDIVVHGANGTAGEHNSRRNPCIVFHRLPFQNWNRKQFTCILVCDVVIGKPFVCTPLVKTAREATEEFRTEWDCCVFHDASGGQAVAVYDPQQVLPRYMVQCHVDVTVTPCPAHPSRAVEYYVADENAFACSHCVVLGKYRKKEVLAIEDAVAQARSRLADYKRDVHQLLVDLEARETDLVREVDDMSIAARRLEAEKEVERIRREAEERVAAVLRALEQAEEDQLNDIKLRRECVSKARDAADTLSENVTTALQHTNPLQILAALQRVQAEDELQYLRGEFRRSCIKINDTENGTRPDAPYAWTRTAIRDDDDALTIAADTGTRVNPLFEQIEDKMQRMEGIHMNTNSRQNYGYTSSIGTGVSTHLMETPQPEKNTTVNSLYAKYLAIASGAGKEEEEKEGLIHQPMNSNVITKKNSESNSALCALSAHPSEIRRAKEDITKGWALYRQGNTEGARRMWNDVYGCHLDNAIGARAQAYIAEALDRDYEAAAKWYDLSLQRDPSDVMTLYNYGVLLETLLGRLEEALMLFERAHTLGDGAAGRRAQQLRVSLGKI